MYRVSGVCVAVALSSLFSGCAIHPQTEDFSGTFLPTIVSKIRCEAKRAIEQVFPDKQDYLRRGTGMTFEFTFVLTENDNATSNGAVTFPIEFGFIKLGWDAGVKKQRETTQTVNVSDAFVRLLSLDCSPEAGRANFAYPITGEIGLLRSFQNYERVANQNTGLLSQFSDDVEFITEIYGSAKPSISLSPVGGRPLSAEGELKISRKDKHKLKVSFTAPKTAEALAKASAKEIQARKLELAKLKIEKSLPTSVLLVGPDGKPLPPSSFSAPGAGNVPWSFQPEGGPGETPAEKTARETYLKEQKKYQKQLKQQRDKVIEDEFRKAGKPGGQGGATTVDEIEQRSFENFERNEQRRLNQELLDELRQQ